MPQQAAFLFPGQGSQTPGMGKDLYEGIPELRSYFDRAEAASPGILTVMFEGPADQLAQTLVAQVALLTVEAALTDLLRTRGIEPSVCAGHSLGEFPALVASSALAFDECLRLVSARARCMHENAPEGGMAAVMGLDSDAIEQHLPPGATVANFNGPNQTIISGAVEGLEKAEELLKAAGAKRVMRLPVSGAFHSPRMEKASAAFGEILKTADLKAPKVPFVSSVSGRAASDPEEIRDLLVRQMCSSVRWTDVMRTLGAVPALEVGPGRVLQGLAKRTEGAPEVRAMGDLDSAKALEGSA